MGNDRAVEISRLNPHDGPNGTIPQGDPMQMMKSIDHKRVEAKLEGRNCNGKEGGDGAKDGNPGKEGEKAPQLKAAKVEFYKESDSDDEPRDHDEKGHLSMWGLLKK